MEIKRIDTTYDTRSDSKGKDPDSASIPLKQYHKLLWSKPLPGGKLFTLADKKKLLLIISICFLLIIHQQ